MFNLHDLYATDVVPLRCNSNTVHSFVIRFAPGSKNMMIGTRAFSMRDMSTNTCYA